MKLKELLNDMDSKYELIHRTMNERKEVEKQVEELVLGKLNFKCTHKHDVKEEKRTIDIDNYEDGYRIGIADGDIYRKITLTDEVMTFIDTVDLFGIEDLVKFATESQLEIIANTLKSKKISAYKDMNLEAKDVEEERKTTNVVVFIDIISDMINDDIDAKVIITLNKDSEFIIHVKIDNVNMYYKYKDIKRVIEKVVNLHNTLTT